MQSAVIVVGPQGCGKTLQAQKLLRHFGLREMFDADWYPGDPVKPGTLYLTCEPVARAVRGALVVPWFSLVQLGVVRDMSPPRPRLLN
jgi:hypothetical protein